MKPIALLSLLSLAPLAVFAEEGHVHKADGSCCSDVSKFVDHDEHAHAHGKLVALSETQRENLALRTEPAGPAKISRTVFALGEFIAAKNGESAAASRVAGRVVKLPVSSPNDFVKKGDTVAVIESRQPGGDPVQVPVIALAEGWVDEMLTRIGEPVSPDTPLMRLSDHRRLIAEAHIPQRHLAGMNPNFIRTRITPEGTAPLFSDYTGGSVGRYDANSGTVIAWFGVPNDDFKLRAGQRAQFRIILSEKDYPVTVPREAVQGEKGDLFVFTEEKEGVYEKHPVVVLDGDELRVAVSGLEAGEKVVTHGAGSLRYADSTSTSLKEALDAAHGHSHGPNGEEPGEESHGKEGHDHHEDAGKPEGKNPLQAELDAAHGHAHGPHGEEPEKTAASHNTPSTLSFLSGDSGAVFFGTLATGEAVLLALALRALRNRDKKEVADA